ncbi:hypothetical protein COV19_01385 [Candidatus Woesearchaeota archaeon CG10_big_fil_rev_8_21_14_0_10_44_13]|nr:MAG: hypothetical protein COV19_01385 [Candidatus Woesearchaeota archaeon CG10_big_fil_rev_8_21_14_0_10_44_13]
MLSLNNSYIRIINPDYHLNGHEVEKMAFGTQKKFDKLNMLLTNSFGNLRNDILRLNQRIDQIEAILANSNLGAMKEFIAFQEKELETMKQMIAEAYAHNAQPAAEAAQEPQQTAQAGVRIIGVQFEGPSDRENPNGEWVEIEGYGVNMSGWMLCDGDNKHVFTFPDGFIIHGKVKVFSGKGRNTSSRLFWKNPTPIWNNEEDIATLFDTQGNVISQVRSAKVHNFEILA